MYHNLNQTADTRAWPLIDTPLNPAPGPCPLAPRQRVDAALGKLQHVSRPVTPANDVLLRVIPLGVG
jgi:hypothetical protein